MKIVKKAVVLGLLLMIKTQATAQKNLLTIDQVVQLTLERNLDLKALRNEVLVAKEQDFKGNAGEIPTFLLNAGDNFQVTGLNQLLLNGTEINRVGVLSNGLNLSATVSYPLFVRYRVEAVKGRIREQATFAETRTQAQAQTLVATAMQRYFDLVRLNDQVKVLERSRAVSEKRLELVRGRMSVGAANDSDLYLAELDLAARRQDILNQQQLIGQAKIDLNQLMLAPRDQNFEVVAEIPLTKGLEVAFFLEKLKKNPELLTLESQIRSSEFLEREVYSLRQPTVRATGGVGYNLANSTAGFSLYSQNYGPNAGITFSMPLFQGKIFDKRHQIAKMTTETRKIQREALEKNLIGNVYRLFETYKTALERLEAETKNVGTAQQYLDLTTKKYELNQATALEIREAQRVFEEAGFRLVALRLTAKQSEIELLRVSGELVK